MAERVHNRRSVRLKKYDYSTPGAYFVTICTVGRANLFDDPVLATFAADGWANLPQHFPTVTLDAFIVMPNHLHGIVWLSDPEDAPSVDRPPCPGLADIVRVLKSSVAMAYLRWVAEHDPNRSARIWQRSYYDHVIRDERELDQIRSYIRDNPVRWAEERDNLDTLITRMTPRGSS
jgi:putative transposase